MWLNLTLDVIQSQGFSTKHDRCAEEISSRHHIQPEKLNLSNTNLSKAEARHFECIEQRKSLVAPEEATFEERHQEY